MSFSLGCEDAYYLTACLAVDGSDLRAVPCGVQAYERARLPRAHQVCAVANEVGLSTVRDELGRSRAHKEDIEEIFATPIGYAGEWDCLVTDRATEAV